MTTELSIIYRVIPTSKKNENIFHLPTHITDTHSSSSLTAMSISPAVLLAYANAQNVLPFGRPLGGEWVWNATANELQLWETIEIGESIAMGHFRRANDCIVLEGHGDTAFLDPTIHPVL